jgi:hypothetical protein
MISSHSQMVIPSDWEAQKFPKRSQHVQQDNHNLAKHHRNARQKLMLNPPIFFRWRFMWMHLWDQKSALRWTIWACSPRHISGCLMSYVGLFDFSETKKHRTAHHVPRPGCFHQLLPLRSCASWVWVPPPVAWKTVLMLDQEVLHHTREQESLGLKNSVMLVYNPH